MLEPPALSLALLWSCLDAAFAAAIHSVESTMATSLCGGEFKRLRFLGRIKAETLAVFQSAMPSEEAIRSNQRTVGAIRSASSEPT